MQTKTMKNMLIMVGVGLALVMSGCNTTKHSDASSSSTTTKPAKPVAKAVTPTTEKTAPNAPALAVKPTSNSVYFSYNRSDLEASASAAVLDGYISWLVDHSGVSVTVEGNCDERGSREFNLALGQARADGVKDYLVAHGVPASRIDTVSFGEERPACTDSGENCWAQNRRADIVTR